MLIAQLSDLHVRPGGQLYRGVVDANARLGAAIEHLQALDRRPDLVIVSGDLVDEGRPDEYAEAAARLNRLSMPLLIVAGNHDSRDALRRAFPQHRYLPASGPLNWCVDDHPLRIVAVDTCSPGSDLGTVDADSLAWLQRTLAAQPDKPTLLVMHHPPFAGGIPYLDDYRYADSEPMAEVLRGFSQIQAVLCGHVHRAMVTRWAGTVVISCPSTATEIALRLQPGAEPQSYLGPTGCMLHLWDGTRGLVSHLCHLQPGAGPYPFF